MKSLTTLLFVLLTTLACVFGSDEITEPCEGNDFSCISKYFEVYENAKESIEASQLKKSTDEAIAQDVVIEYGFFNTTLTRPKIHVSGLDKANIEKFAIFEKEKKALILIHFPEVHLKGDNQIYEFHEVGLLDVEVKLPFDEKFHNLYTTKIFNVTDKGLLNLKSAETNSEADSLLKLKITDVLKKAGEKHPFVAEILAQTNQYPDVWTREYAVTIGRVLTNLFEKRFY